MWDYPFNLILVPHIIHLIWILLAFFFADFATSFDLCLDIFAQNSFKTQNIIITIAT